MNELTNELWTRVCQDEMPELDVTYMTPQRQRKFAELIVRECMEMSKLERGHYMDQAKAAKSKQAFDYEFNASSVCLGVELRIKKHFGVEE